MEIINLDMTPSTVTPNAHAGQYDSARTVRFMLKNGGVPFTLAGTETITAEITRSDNTEVTVNVANTSSNYVDVVFDDTVCTVKGLYACELRLKDSDGFDIGSKNFALLVQRDPYDGAGVHVETVGPADICTFETTLAEPLQSVTVDIVATGGYDADTQTAHPINGYSSANITRCGVNFAELSDDNKYNEQRVTYSYANNGVSITATGTYARIGYSYKVKKGVQYTISFYGRGTADFLNVYYNNDNAWSDSYGRSYITSTRTKFTKTITATSDTLFIGFYVSSAGTTGDMVIEDFMLEVGSTASDTFTPYNGQTYTVNFGQTVYGGVLDVTSGKLHVTTARLDLDSPDLTYSYNTSAGVAPYFYANISGVKYEGPFFSTVYNSRCNIYTCTKRDVTTFFDKTYCFDGSAGNVSQLQIKDLDYTDPITFKASLSSAYIIYELATPFDIDLTPEVILAIVGTNNVFADCGETTVKYLEAGA